MTAVRWVVEHPPLPSSDWEAVHGARPADWVEYPDEATARRHAGTAATVWALIDAASLAHLKAEREPVVIGDFEGVGIDSRTTHVYLSTACLHGLHDWCGKAQHDRGEPGHPRCKFCPARCTCACHDSEPEPVVWAQPLEDLIAETRATDPEFDAAYTATKRQLASESVRDGAIAADLPSTQTVRATLYNALSVDWEIGAEGYTRAAEAVVRLLTDATTETP